MKKFIYIIIFICMFSVLYRQNNIEASSSTNVHLIFDKKSYLKGEEVKLTVNLENFNNLSETKIIIKCNELALMPIEKDGSYGHLLNNSIYEEALLNEYVDSTYLRFHLIKKNLSNGYYSGYKNNVGEFYFEAKVYIDNIYDYFSDSSFDEVDCGFNINLYDIYNRLIDVEIKYSEKIQVEWNKEKYVVDVYSSVPNYLLDIKILNRKESEYELLTEKDIDVNKIGTKIINLAIIDKTNGDYILLSKAVEVIDRFAPVISGDSNVIIDSTNLEKFDLSNYYLITDNYDSLLNNTIKYFDNNRCEINGLDEFINYLSSNLEGYITISSIDSSNNKSDEFLINVSINDVTAPKISQISTFMIEDYNLSSFNFNELISVTDDYDLVPKLVFNVYLDDLEVIDYISYLKKGNELLFVYFGIDNKMNKTKTYTCVVSTIDTTSPVISEVPDKIVNDKDVMNYDFTFDVLISDNIDVSPKLVVSYYIDDVVYEYEEWKLKLVKGHNGYFTYYGIDNSENKTEIYNCKIKVVDTTAPVIRVNNIKEYSKYLKVDKIDYEVIDNFDGNIEIFTTLNDVIYNGDLVNKPGDYTFKVIAKDSSGNESTKIIEFKIIDNDVISCGDDVECYVDNYLQVVCIVGVLMVLILAMLGWKLIIMVNKKKKRKE